MRDKDKTLNAITHPNAELALSALAMAVKSRGRSDFFALPLIFCGIFKFGRRKRWCPAEITRIPTPAVSQPVWLLAYDPDFTGRSWPGHPRIEGINDRT